MTLTGPAAGIGKGVGFLPADRKAGGAFMVRPVAENVAVASWRQAGRRSASSSTLVQEARAYRRWHDKLSHPLAQRPTPGDGHAVRRQPAEGAAGPLAGAQVSKVLVLIEPTRGVDVGARQDIYARAPRARGARASPILISTSDYEEAVQVADRVYVMAKGKVVDRAHRRRRHDRAPAAASGG